MNHKPLLYILLLALVGSAHVEPQLICHEQTYTPQAQEPPSVYISVDESGSMDQTDGTGQTRLARAQDGLLQLTDLTETSRLGLGGFSGACDGSGVNEYLATGEHTEQELIDAIDQLQAGGWTPMHAAVRDIRENNRLHVMGTSDNEHFAVLIGDGEPNNCQCDYPDYASQTSDTCVDPVAQEIDALYQELGVRTFIIGFAFKTETYNQFAHAGRTSNPFDDENDYFLADDAQSLVDALEQIYSSVQCTIPLEETPPSEEEIWVSIGEEPVPPDQFIYDEQANTLQLTGAACQQLTDEQPTVQIRFGCGPPTCAQPAPQRVFGAGQTHEVSYQELFDGDTQTYPITHQAPPGVHIEERTDGTGVRITNEEASAHTQIPFTYQYPESVTCELEALLTQNPVVEDPPEDDDDGDGEDGDDGSDDDGDEDDSDDGDGDDGEDGDEDDDTSTTISSCDTTACRECEDQACLQANNCLEDKIYVYNPHITTHPSQLIDLPGAFTANLETLGEFTIDPTEGATYTQYTITSDAENEQTGALVAQITPHNFAPIKVCAQLQRINYDIESPPQNIGSPLLVVGTRVFTEIIGEQGPHIFSAKVWVP